MTTDQSSSSPASRRLWNTLQGSLTTWTIIFWKGCIPIPSLCLPHEMQIRSIRMKAWRLWAWLQPLKMELLPFQTSLNPALLLQALQLTTGRLRSNSSSLQLGQRTSPRLVFSTALMELQHPTCFLLAFLSHCVVISVSTIKNVPSLTKRANSISLGNGIKFLLKTRQRFWLIAICSVERSLAWHGHNCKAQRANIPTKFSYLLGNLKGPKSA